MSQADTWIRRYPVPNYHFGPRCHVDAIPPFGHRRMPEPKEKDALHDGFGDVSSALDSSTVIAKPGEATWNEGTPQGDTHVLDPWASIDGWTEA